MTDNGPTNEIAVTFAAERVAKAWEKMKAVCPHRCPDRDDEGQGPICAHDENSSGMEWCEPGSCPFLSL